MDGDVRLMRRNRGAAGTTRRAASIVLCALVSLTTASAQQDPIADALPTFWRPATLGVSLLDPFSGDDPLTLFQLPHRSADTRMPRIAASAGGSIGTGTAGGGLALTIPARRFVVGSGLAIAGDGDGLFGAAAASLARPIAPRTSLGTSVMVTMADDGNRTRGGMAFALGAAGRLTAGPTSSDVTVHVALTGLGAIASRPEYDPVLAPVTPLVGVSAILAESPTARVAAHAALRAPTLSALAVEAGLALSIRDRISFGAGWSSFVAGGGRAAAVWPGLSVGVRFGMTSDASAPGTSAHDLGSSIAIAAQPTRDGNAIVGAQLAGTFRSADIAEPEVVVEVDAPLAAAPGMPGTSIALAPVEGRSQLVLTVVANDNVAIESIETSLRNPAGVLIREWTTRPVPDSRPGGGFTDRLTTPLQPDSAVARIVWNAAAAPADGRYRLDASARDRAGNVARADTLFVDVDRTPPRLAVSVFRYELASGDVAERPLARLENGAGAVPRETVERQADAAESHAIAPDDGVEVRIEVGDASQLGIEVRDAADRAIRPLVAQPSVGGGYVTRWDGTGPNGRRVPEGSYRVVARARDQLGNEARLSTGELLVRRTQPRLSAGLNSAPGEDVVLRARISLDPLVGLRDWTAILVDADNTEIRRWSGIDLPPDVIRIDSRLVGQDGEYRLLARSSYVNGSFAEAVSEPVVVDRTPPRVAAGVARSVIRPASARRLTVFIEHDDTARAGRVVLEPLDGAHAGREIPVSPVPDSIDVPLIGNDGGFLPPGRYRMVVELEDAAGNRAASLPRTVELLPRIEDVDVAFERSAFSPNGDGRLDRVGIALGMPSTATNGAFRIEIWDERERVVRSLEGPLPAPDRIEWDGRDNAGLPAADGAYRPVLEATTADGATRSGTGEPVRLDTTPPRVTLAGDQRFVSPDGDGNLDRLGLDISLPDDFENVQFRVRRAGATVPVTSPKIESETIDWLPAAVDGTPLPDGEYELDVAAFDAAANRGVSDPLRFEVRTRPVSGFVRISAPAVSPNGDGFADTLEIVPVLTSTDSLVTWELVVAATAASTPVFRAGGDIDLLPQPVVWPPAGARLSDGRYRATLTARYAYGPVVEATTPEFRLDATPPEISVEVTPQPFSPDNDGTADVVTFAVDARDDSALRYWVIEVFEPTGEFFYDIGGESAPPPRIVWDGVARNGERVLSAERYPWVLEVADDLGNIARTEGTLQVDVLLEAFGEGYRIQVPSITFAPNSADLELDPATDAGRRNREVLDRVADILRRFPDYRITVEGHAVNVSGSDREQRDELVPLSRRRAQSVRAALIDRGIPSAALDAVGRGGAAPIVPHSDTVNRWKNRRVDFLLQR